MAISNSEFTFLAVGDIMLSRNVAAKMVKAKNPLLPFSQLEELLLNTDFNLGNLESPFSGKDSYPQTGSLVFNAPRWAMQGLREYNFKVLSLANNHTLDQGLKGLIYTKNYLTQNNIQAIGVGQNLTETWQPAVIEAKGVKIGFIAVSYASLNDNGKKTNNNVARIEDLANLKTAITQAKVLADLVVVNMHAGTEYKHKPNSAQIKFAHAAVDYGADLVIGHHPHWVQTVEKYNGSPPHPACKKSSFDNPVTVKDGKKYQALDLGNGCGGKYIFYSLGNFIFDQMWSTKTRQGLAVKFTVKVDSQTSDTKAVLNKAELIPVIIDNYSTPRLANVVESQAILKSIGVVDEVIDLSPDN
ncbi:MAG: CapA family protein [Candidatus Kerfeldbacteria bacterium]|nr:CapA family protein [Candidatus Kerfeldbacteria bacterium]